ncbi:MAG: hypothetical protein ACYCSF_10880 [Acidimicrobiales bacterium]
MSVLNFVSPYELPAAIGEGRWLSGLIGGPAGEPVTADVLTAT